MKKMLIIGNKYPGIKSVSFAEVDSVNITDYQLLLIDLTNYQEIGLQSRSIINASIQSLLKNNHHVICLLPRNNFHEVHPPMFPFDFSVVSKSGATVSFIENDKIMNFYKKFISSHKIILRRVPATYLNSSINPIMSNNINEPCSVKNRDFLYLLHPPDKNLHKEAIKSLVDYFSPDIEEDIEEKPDWVNNYELVALGIQNIEKEIKDINSKIGGLEEIRDKKIMERENIAKWSDLITRQGTILEIRLKEAFKLLGVEKVEHEPKGKHGPDLEIQHKTMGFTVEIEGTKSSIKIDKARELLHWIADAPSEYKGVLIGNPFRELEPVNRPPANNRLFVKETEELAQKRDFTLICSYEIFKLICKKLKGEEVNIDTTLNKIFEGKGEINLI